LRDCGTRQLTNLVNGKPRKPNHDVTTVRVATTTDGITFTDVGVASGLNDPTTVALNGHPLSRQRQHSAARGRALRHVLRRWQLPRQ
jgi:hypothetical protein